MSTTTAPRSGPHREPAREGRAFALSALAVATVVAGCFLALFPDVLPSSTGPDRSMTVAGAAAGPYTLRILTWVAACGAPVVIAYQAWTYWVFRRRIGCARKAPTPAPIPAPAEDVPDRPGPLHRSGEEDAPRA
ncbi:cytochrome d ubiquinol oxidase subunit II [Streptomyces sp. NPDC090045]|uniref:cytochrome d ubiquinol oxidase subunit II n=1 Tax=Streptomyces sp. NPDC090045 TaxID=3365927 RepID=UPI00380E4849